MKNIRKARIEDLNRIAEIEVFNYRLNFYPIFKDDTYYFSELQVSSLTSKYRDLINELYVYDDGVIKAFIMIDNSEVKKLFVEPVLQGKGLGSKLLRYALDKCNVKYLWALEKNTRAINFYLNNGFKLSEDKKIEEDTNEYLIKLVYK